MRITHVLISSKWLKKRLFIFLEKRLKKRLHAHARSNEKVDLLTVLPHSLKSLSSKTGIAKFHTKLNHQI